MSSYREIYQTVSLHSLTTARRADEFIIRLEAVWSQRMPEAVCPSGVGVVLKCRIGSTIDGNYFRFPCLVFDGTSGAACRRYETDNSLLFNLAVDRVHELPNSTFNGASNNIGGSLIIMSDLSIYTFNSPASPDESGQYQAVGTTLWPWSGYWDGSSVSTEFMWDPLADLFVLANSSPINQAEVRVFKASTGDYADTVIPLAGYSEGLVNCHPPYGMSFSRNNMVTQFNYETGQVMHVGKLPDYDVARGAAVSDRIYGFNRYNNTILFADLTDQDTEDRETVVIRGCNANPIPFDIVGPYVNYEPRIGRKVKIFARVIGGAGEGIGSRPVTFIDEGIGDVAPVEVFTDPDGWAVAQYDGLYTGGAETITATVVQDDAVFPPTSAQGTGAGATWSPTVHLNFNFLDANQDVSNILVIQENWSQAGGYGCFGETVVVRDVNQSCCELQIKSGTTGETTGTEGTFGGDVDVDYSTSRAIATGEEFWCGAWVRFPTGFDFSTSGSSLRLFQMRDSVSTFSDPDDDIVVEIGLKHGGGTTHTGWDISWPNQTVTDTRHDFTADSSVLLQADTWHWVQYYCKYESWGPDCIQRLYVDDLIAWELNGDAAQYRDSAGAGSLTSFTANESIRNSNASWSRMDEARVFRFWEGGAPSDQTCYISNLVWSKDTTNALPEDENGNQYISTAIAGGL